MEKREKHEEFFKKDDVLNEIMAAMMFGRSMPIEQCLMTLFNKVSHLDTYTSDAKPVQKTDEKIDTHNPAPKTQAGRIHILPIPKYVRFNNVCGENFQHSDVRPFVSPQNYILQVCQKVIDCYGAEALMQRVFDKSTESSADLSPYFTNDRRIAASDNRVWIEIADGFFVLGCFDFPQAVDLAQKLVKYFPNANHQFLIG